VCQKLQLYCNFINLILIRTYPYNITKIFIYCRIWDKITVGAYRILVFVAVVTLTTLRRLLLRCESIDHVLDTINNVRLLVKLSCDRHIFQILHIVLDNGRNIGGDSQ